MSVISPLEASTILWHEGELSWMLHDGQKALYDSYINSKSGTIVWNCARRLGKTYTLLLIAIEQCLKKPNARVLFCCAKQKDARSISRDGIREILVSCPDEIRPEFKTQEGVWVFKNGSRLDLMGLDQKRADAIRGKATDLTIIDEAGLVTDLDFIVKDIIIPTNITTKGKVILASTPPKSSTHPFVSVFINKARIEGNLVTKTIYDNNTLSPDRIEEIIDEVGGINSNSARREYLCEIIIDAEYAIIPEFTPEVYKNTVKEWKLPPIYDAYVAMDVGMKDLTVVLFALYDFRAAKIIVLDEFVTSGQKFNTSKLAEAIKEKESKIYYNELTGECVTPLRVSDTNLILIQDLWQLHQLRFIPTRKDQADAALNNLKIMIQNEKIIIHPRCKTLIMHLQAGIWNKSKTSFERSGDYGHFDAIDSLKYLVRNVQLNKNPYPSGWGLNNFTDCYGNPLELSYSANNSYTRNFKENPYDKIFNIKRNK